ncbi:hypothetical protein ATCC90586_011435 [Pythium insidiosum]|nr:hypothetical protein ATCC90586_011435 [Pythium insidiosum]
MTEDETKELLRLRDDSAKARMRSNGPISTSNGTSTSTRSSASHNGNGAAGSAALPESDSNVKRNSSAAFPTASVAGIKPLTWMFFSFAAGLIYGYNVSMAAPLQYIRDDLKLSSSQQEAVSATATLSDACSMLVGGHLADRYGRALMSSLLSVSFSWLVVWRLCSGVGNGLSILLLPMYISECVDAEHRGTYLTLFQLGVNSGCAFPYLFMILVDENWRSCLAFGSLPALFVLYNLSFHFPESIRWLRWKQDPDGFDLESAENEPKPHLELLIGVLLAYVNNCVDASLFYGPVIISNAIPHFSRKDANIFGLACSLLAAFSVLFAARFLINSLPRRQLYLLCLVVVTLTFVISGIIFAKYSTDDFAHDPIASGSVIITFAIMNIFAAIGPSILFVVILSELFTDSSYRARYMSYCTFSMSLISLLVNGSLLTLFETFGTAMTFIGWIVDVISFEQEVRLFVKLQLDVCHLIFQLLYPYTFCIRILRAGDKFGIRALKLLDLM